MLSGLKKGLLLLAGLLALRLVLMAFVPVFDTSESRYAAISANMARTGDFVVPRFTYEGRYQSFDGKPPLVFQAGGLCCQLLGTESPVALQFAVRLFPLVSALLLLVILFQGVKRFSDTETAFLATLVCATATAFYAAAGICMTDMSLTCCVAGALVLYRCFAEDRRFVHAVGVLVLLGAGMIVKGPVALVLFGLPVFVDACVNRRWRAVFSWQWLAAAPVFFLISAPWFVLVEGRNPGSVFYFFYNENFLRFVQHDYGDKYGAGREAFRGVAILWAFVATLPWSLTPFFKGLKKFPLRDFFLLSAVTITAFWCLTSRVLLYYLFPVIPLFAAALALHGERKILMRIVPWAAGLSAFAIAATLIGGAFGSEKMQGARAPETYGFDGYSHEFYHGTNAKCQTGPGVSLEDWGRERWLRHLEAERATQGGRP